MPGDAPANEVSDEQGSAFRAELGQYLQDHHPGKPPRESAARLDFARRWAAQLADAGYAGPAWPKLWGGMGLESALQVIYHEEVAKSGVPQHPSPAAFMVGPTLMRYGTTAQRERFLRDTLRADILWCQGFSEPDAGSDLGSLRTRARRDGADYVVDGAKIWTSRAAEADWMFALVRTGTLAAAGPAGISYLLIDMKSPGVSVMPVRDMTGSYRFAQVSFDSVRVPIGNLVGTENGGWSLARTTLGHERSTSRIPAILRYRRVLQELLDLAKTTGAAREPVLRDELARLVTDCEALILTSQRIVADILRWGEPGPASSIFRLAHAQFEQRLHEVALQVIGSAGMLGPKDPRSPQGGRWTWGFLNTRASTIGAGTSEIQRNTIAERVLGLPRLDEPQKIGEEN